MTLSCWPGFACNTGWGSGPGQALFRYDMWLGLAWLSMVWLELAHGLKPEPVMHYSELHY